MGPAVSFSSVNNRFASLVYMKWDISSEQKDSILRTAEHQVSSTICGLMGNTSKQAPSNVQTSFSMAGEVLQNPWGHLEQKNAPNTQQGLLQKGVTSICKACLRCSIGYCCEDSKSQGGMRGEILPSQVGIHAHGKKKIEQFSFSKQLLRRTWHLAQSSCQQETNWHQQSMKGLTCVQNLANTRKRRKQEKLDNSWVV